MLNPLDKQLIQEMEHDDLQSVISESADDDILDIMAEDLSPREETFDLFPMTEEEAIDDD